MRTRGLDGEPIGCAHANPLFNTREYEVEFTDGTNEKYQASIIAKNMFAQVDSEGNQYLLLLQEIMDHKKDNSVIPMSDRKISSANGQPKPKITTRGWFLIVQWRDGSTSWEKLKDLKASNLVTLVEVTEYAVVNRLVKNLPSNGGCHTSSIAEIGLSPRSSHTTGRHTQVWDSSTKDSQKGLRDQQDH
jgi:hypothetical protein